MTVATCLAGLNPTAYRQHRLHDPQRNWPETNCYVDLWIEVLHALGMAPEAALGFTVTQDFEGDQFTFFKFPPEDLALLFGLSVQELAIYDSVEAHSLEQLRRGRLVLVEVDSFYLPDTHGVSYGVTHGKTTIAINHLDTAGGKLHYFHNAGYYALDGANYDGIFRSTAGHAVTTLFPYVEFVKRGLSPTTSELPHMARMLLKKHLAVRPASNPLEAFALVFPQHAQQLAERPMEFFHLYAFNTLRQIGANFEMLASHLDWLSAQGDTGLTEVIAAGNEIAGGAKVLQFQLARAMSRKRFDKLADSLTPLVAAYDTLMQTLVQRYA